MEFDVKNHGKTVGTCQLQEKGLYWHLTCRCQVLSNMVERLYAGEKSLGVLDKQDDCLFLSRSLSKTSTPELPPKLGYLTLHPTAETWQGQVAGYDLCGQLRGEEVLISYDENAPCPCEPLICFFTIEDGFWHLPLRIQG